MVFRKWLMGQTLTTSSNAAKALLTSSSRTFGETHLRITAYSGSKPYVSQNSISFIELGNKIVKHLSLKGGQQKNEIDALQVPVRAPIFFFFYCGCNPQK